MSIVYDELKDRPLAEKIKEICPIVLTTGEVVNISDYKITEDNVITGHGITKSGDEVTHKIYL